MLLLALLALSGRADDATHTLTVGAAGDVHFPSAAPTHLPIAIAFAHEHNLNSGHGCDSQYCVAQYLAKAMAQIASTGALQDQTAIIEALTYGPESQLAISQEGAKTATHRPPPASPHEASGEFAAVPCVPPYCSFECAATALRASPPPFAWPPPARQCGDRVFRPLWIPVPASAIVSCVPRKYGLLADAARTRLNPGEYRYTHLEEHEYKRAYRRAFFGPTRQKAGWDALRHVEILASGTIPYFHSLEDSPPGALPHLPKALLVDLRKSAEACEAAGGWPPDDTACNTTMWYEASAQLLAHTRDRLTTRAMAKYVLEASGNAEARTVLYLSGHGAVDYVRDLALHGFDDLLGADNVRAFVRPEHMYEVPPDTEPKEWSNKDLYGLGFTYARWMRGGEGAAEQGTVGGQILGEIAERRYDVVVFGAVHRGMPFLDEVTRAYAKEQIIFLDGEDAHGWCASARALVNRGHYFMREMPEGCPS